MTVVDWRDVITAEERVLAAAVRAGDWMSQGYSHLAIGLACRELGDLKRARQQLGEAAYLLGALGVGLF